jgi:hypothetical protein
MSTFPTFVSKKDILADEQSELDAYIKQSTAVVPSSPAASQMPADPRGRILANARQRFGDEGERVVNSILETEGGLSGSVGDTNLPGGGSYGPLQFYKRYGMLPAYAASLGVDEDTAGEYARRNPEHAADWAMQGYLGRVLQQGIQQGLSGPELATYVQRNAQRSDAPERAGHNYARLYGGAYAAPVTTAATGASGGPAGGLSRLDSPDMREESLDDYIQRTDPFKRMMQEEDESRPFGPSSAGLSVEDQPVPLHSTSDTILPGTRSDELNRQAWEAISPETRARNWEQTWRSLKAGGGDIVKGTGQVLDWLGIPSGQQVMATGEKIIEEAKPTPYDWSAKGWGSLADPEYWRTEIARQLPLQAPLMALSGGVSSAVQGVAGRVGLGTVGRQVVGNVAGGSASRLLESALEAGDAYEQAKAKGMSEGEAFGAGREVFLKNLPLAGPDAVETFLTFGKAPKPVKEAAGSALSLLGGKGHVAARILFSGGTEMGEEYLQNVAQKEALKEPDPWAFDEGAQRAAAAGLASGVSASGIGMAGQRVIESPRVREAARIDLREQTGGLDMRPEQPSITDEVLSQNPEQTLEEALGGGQSVNVTHVRTLNPTPVAVGDEVNVLASGAGRGKVVSIQPGAIRVVGNNGVKRFDFTFRSLDDFEANTQQTLNDQARSILTGPEAAAPQTTKAYSPSDPNTAYDLRYKVVPLDSLVTSQTDSLEDNPAYPRELQPRDRTTQASKLQVQQMAQGLNPELLLEDSNLVSHGAMIVGPDRVVESGNGRTLALRAARATAPEAWQSYQQALRAKAAQLGIDPEQMAGIQDPVLVRERVSNVDRVQFVNDANASTTLTMNPAERAQADVRLVSDESLATMKIAETQTVDQALTSSENQQVVNGFLAGLPANERAALVDPNGALNSEGLRRLKNAIFAKTYRGDAGSRLTSAFTMSIDPAIKNVENGLFASLPAMARAEALVASGQRDADLSLGEDLAKAVDVLARLKQSRTPVADYLAQITMFNRELTPQQERLLTHLNTLSRTPRKVRELLQGYAQAVESAPPPQQMSMFDLERPSKEDILDRIIERQEQDASGSGLPLFAGAPEPAVSGQASQEHTRVDAAVAPDTGREVHPATAPAAEPRGDAAEPGVEPVTDVAQSQPEPSVAETQQQDVESDKPAEAPQVESEPAEDSLVAVSLDDVSYDRAVRAYEGTSHFPEDRAKRVQSDYVAHMQQVEASLRPLANTPEKVEQLRKALERYRQNYLAHLNAYLDAHSRVVSAFVVGPARFPTQQMEKRHATVENRLNEWLEWSKKAQAGMRRDIAPEASRIISSDNPEAVTLLEKKIASKRKYQETMLAANEIVRNKKLTDEQKVEQLVALEGIGAGSARKLLQKDFAGRIGFPDYALTNNRSEIKRLEWRLAELQKNRATPGGEMVFDGGTIVDNADENRIQIVFDDKPDAATREKLKRYGFKWAPSQNAWQRQRTDNARAVIAQLFPDAKPVEAAKEAPAADGEFVRPQDVNQEEPVEPVAPAESQAGTMARGGDAGERARDADGRGGQEGSGVLPDSRPAVQPGEPGVQTPVRRGAEGGPPPTTFRGSEGFPDDARANVAEVIGRLAPEARRFIETRQPTFVYYSAEGLAAADERIRNGLAGAAVGTLEDGTIAVVEGKPLTPRLLTHELIHVVGSRLPFSALSEADETASKDGMALLSVEPDDLTGDVRDAADLALQELQGISTDPNRGEALFIRMMNSDSPWVDLAQHLGLSRTDSQWLTLATHMEAAKQGGYTIRFPHLDEERAAYLAAADPDFAERTFAEVNRREARRSVAEPVSTDAETEAPAETVAGNVADALQITQQPESIAPSIERPTEEPPAATPPAEPPKATEQPQPSEGGSTGGRGGGAQAPQAQGPREPSDDRLHLIGTGYWDNLEADTKRAIKDAYDRTDKEEIGWQETLDDLASTVGVDAKELADAWRDAEPASISRELVAVKGAIVQNQAKRNSLQRRLESDDTLTEGDRALIQQEINNRSVDHFLLVAGLRRRAGEVGRALNILKMGNEGALAKVAADQARYLTEFVKQVQKEVARDGLSGELADKTRQDLDDLATIIEHEVEKTPEPEDLSWVEAADEWGDVKPSPEATAKAEEIANDSPGDNSQDSGSSATPEEKPTRQPGKPRQKRERQEEPDESEDEDDPNKAIRRERARLRNAINEIAEQVVELSAERIKARRNTERDQDEGAIRAGTYGPDDLGWDNWDKFDQITAERRDLIEQMDGLIEELLLLEKEQLTEKEVRDALLKRAVSRLVSKETAKVRQEVSGQGEMLAKTERSVQRALDRELAKETLATIKRLLDAGADSQAFREQAKLALKQLSTVTNEAEKQVKAYTEKATMAEARKVIGDEASPERLQEVAAEIAKLDWTDPRAVAQFASAVSKPSRWQYVHTYRVASMLSGSATLLVNALGNAIEVLSKVPIRVAAAAAEGPKATVEGRSSAASLKMARAEWAGLIGALPSALREFRTTLSTGFTSRPVRDLTTYKADMLGGPLKPLNYIFRAMAATDDFARTMSRAGSLMAYAQREADRSKKSVQYILANLTEYPWVAELASKEANRTTYTERLTGIFRAIQMSRHNPGVQLLIPMFQTLANISRMGVERTGYGLRSAHMVEREAVKKFGEYQPGTLEESARLRGEAMLGLSIFFGSLGLTLAGAMTAYGPGDDDERKDWRDKGGQSFAAKVPGTDRWVGYGNVMAAWAIPMALGSAVGEAVIEANKQQRRSERVGKGPAETALDAAAVGLSQAIIRGGRYWLEVNALRGASDFVRAIVDPGGESRLGRLVEGTATSFVPAGGAWASLARATDDEIKNPEGLVEEIKARLPILSQEVPEAVTQLGETRRRGASGVGALSPLRVSGEASNAIYDEYQRLRGEGYDFGIGDVGSSVSVPIRVGGKSYSYTVDLDNAEQTEWQKTAGKLTADYLRRVMASEGYRKLSDDKKARALEMAVERARKDAAPAYLRTWDPEKLRERVLQKQKQKQLRAS